MEAADDLVHEEITAEECAADEGFWSIYESSFPVEELEPKEVILDSCAEGGRLFRTRCGGRTVAMATTQLLPKIQTLFLVYLAVDRSMRGRSVGSQLIEFFFLRAAETVPGMNGMVWEVDRIEDSHDEADREKREKRLRFFRHHGGSVIPYGYRQPALDGVHPVPMHLVFRSNGGASVAGRDLAREIYFGKYGKVNGIAKEHLEDLLEGKEPPRPPFGT